MNYQIAMDLHTHTLVSGHAYNTMLEMAQAAADKGLKLLGITEHAPAMPGSCGLFYFQNLKIVPRERFGVELLLGAEVNIMDYDGTVDLEPRELAKLDLAIASLHSPCIPHGTKEENTRALLRVMENPYVNIIGHPDDARYPVDYRALVEGAKERHKVLELNNHSLSPLSYRQGARENDLRMLELCKEYQTPILVNSDAHVDQAVGELSNGLSLLAEADFPEELVLNRSREAVLPYLTKYQNRG